jgi:SAM-dependent methyltransferase
MAITPLLAPLVESLKRRFFTWEDQAFARRFGLELGPVWREDLVSDDAESSAHANACQAVWCRNLREIFKETRKLDAIPKNFVDIGSGKGKACFFAATKMSFERIIGVEFSKPLVLVAKENAARLGRSDLVFIHADARNFPLPEACNLVFLFNPFDEIILQQFIANNLEHFQRHRSILAYANDLHREVLTDAGFTLLFRNHIRCLSLYKMPGGLNAG